jgi:hypothetical protein
VSVAPFADPNEISLGTKDGKVVMMFGTVVFTLAPETAIELATAIASTATLAMVEAGTVEAPTHDA